MAKAKKSRKKSRSINKSKKGSGGVKPLKTKMTKRQLVEHIAAVVEGTSPPSREARQRVARTLDVLTETMSRSIMPGGFGTFMLPKLLKVTLKTRKAIKKGTMVRSPATGGMVPSKGRPESQSVKIRPLALLKKAAAGQS